jgi:hypothetical protein
MLSTSGVLGDCPYDGREEKEENTERDGTKNDMC